MSSGGGAAILFLIATLVAGRLLSQPLMRFERRIEVEMLRRERQHRRSLRNHYAR
jgi:hypothetical protein